MASDEPKQHFLDEEQLLNDVLPLFGSELPVDKVALAPYESLQRAALYAAFRQEAHILKLLKQDSVLTSETLRVLEDTVKASINNLVPESRYPQRLPHPSHKHSWRPTWLTRRKTSSITDTSPYPKLRRLQGLLEENSGRPKSLERLKQYIELGKDGASCEDLINRLVELNARQVQGVAVTTPTLHKKEETAEVLSDKFRDSFVSLHASLTKKFRCSCDKTHFPGLRLATHQQFRTQRPEKIDVEISFTSEEEKDDKWRETKVSVLQSTGSKLGVRFEEPEEGDALRIDLKKKKSLDAICRAITKVVQYGPILLLLANGSFYAAEIPFYKPSYATSKQPQSISLHNAIDDRGLGQSRDRKSLTSKGKLVLAVVVANALLPLFQTPWLKDLWDSTSILFFHSFDDSPQPLIAKPFLVNAYGWSRGSTGYEPFGFDEDPVHPIPCLLSLAIFLCELAIGEPIGKRLVGGDWSDLEPTAQAKYRAAHTVLDSMSGSGVDQYRDAVEACLKSSWLPEDMNPAEISFGSTDVRQRIYNHIVRPLEELLQIAYGISVEDIEKIPNYELFRRSSTEETLFAGLAKSFTGSPMRGRKTIKPDHTSFSLFDVAFDVEKSKEECADEWLRNLDWRLEKYLPKTVAPEHRARIAIIDTGFDIDNAEIADQKERIVGKRTWVENGNAEIDVVGHGTHALDLLLRLAPLADVYVAQIAGEKKLLQKDWIRINEAIAWAVEQQADIITMSFGLRGEVEDVRLAIRDAYSAHEHDCIMFAAASNSGGTAGRAYPASDDSKVICVHSSDGLGNKSGFSPTPQKGHNNFSLLGEGVESSWPRGAGDYADGTRRASGTSVATPIAAALAATIITFVRHHAKPADDRLVKFLKTHDGMTAVFKMMVTNNGEGRDGYDVLNFSALFDNDTPEDVYRRILKELRKVYEAY